MRWRVWVLRLLAVMLRGRSLGSGALAWLTYCEARTSKSHCWGAPLCLWGLLGCWVLSQGRTVEDTMAEPRSLLLSLPAPFSSQMKCLHFFKMTLLPRCFPSQDMSKFLLCASKCNAFLWCWSFRMEMKISEQWQVSSAFAMLLAGKPRSEIT